MTIKANKNDEWEKIGTHLEITFKGLFFEIDQLDNVLRIVCDDFIIIRPDSNRSIVISKFV